MPDLAAELVRLRVDVIVAPASHVLAAKRAIQTIPIVMAGSVDPVSAGLVASLAQPDGSVTGLSLLSIEVTGKQWPSKFLQGLETPQRGVPVWGGV